MVIGILENALIMYLKEKKPKFLFFKDRKGMNRSLRKKTEDPVIIPGKFLIQFPIGVALEPARCCWGHKNLWNVILSASLSCLHEMPLEILLLGSLFLR